MEDTYSINGTSLPSVVVERMQVDLDAKPGSDDGGIGGAEASAASG